MSSTEDGEGPDGGDAKGAKAERPTRRRAKSATDLIDIRSALEAPVRIKQDGAVRSLDPFEATLRQHLRKALVDKSIASMKFVLEQAERHQLIKRPPPPKTGGVFVIPKEVPDEVQSELFEWHPELEEHETVVHFFSILRRFIDELE